MGNILTSKFKKNNVQPTIQPERLSEEDVAINMIVDRYLSDEHINSMFIPDAVEKRIYRNILRIVTGVVKDTLGHAHVEVLGHRIDFQITPIAPLTPASVTSEITSSATNRDG